MGGVDALWHTYRTEPTTQNRSRLAQHYVSFVKSIARRVAFMMDYRVQPEDMLGSGLIGLHQSIKRYDPDAGTFKAFAYPRVRGAMLDELRKIDSASRAVRTWQKEIRQAEAEAAHELGHAPDDRQIAAKLGISVQSFRERRAWVYRSTVFAEIVHESAEGQNRYETDESTPLPEQTLIDDEDFAELLVGLTAREKTVLTLYFVQDLTKDEIAETLNVSPSLAGRVFEQAVDHIRWAQQIRRRQNKMGRGS